MLININDTVRIKLKPRGHELHAAHYSHFGAKVPRKVEDVDGGRNGSYGM